jgi:Uma2 family endonuclease
MLRSYDVCVSNAAELVYVSESTYLEREEARGPEDLRSEYIDGVIVAMTGSSKAHNRIAFNLASRLVPAADAHGCRASLLDVQVRIEKPSSVARYYPDVVVACAESDDSHSEEAPCLIAEVLSPSTKWVDRREKRFAYLGLASLKHYLLIDPETRTVEHVERPDGVWVTSVHDITATLHLTCPVIDLPVADLFVGV